MSEREAIFAGESSEGNFWDLSYLVNCSLVHLSIICKNLYIILDAKEECRKSKGAGRTGWRNGTNGKSMFYFLFCIIVITFVNTIMLWWYTRCYTRSLQPAVECWWFTWPHKKSSYSQSMTGTGPDRNVGNVAYWC